jgi:DNA-binding transcriptional regulator YiaG
MRRQVKDDAKHLTTKQVKALMAHDGLGESCEYDTDVLRMRYNDIGEKAAAKVGHAWDRENGRGNAAPESHAPPLKAAKVTDDLAFLHFMRESDMTVNDCAALFGVTGAAVRYWVTGQRATPPLVLKLIKAFKTRPELMNYFL